MLACESFEDVFGHATCEGPNVKTYRAKAPWSDQWFICRWCDICAAAAREERYRVHTITVPAND